MMLRTRVITALVLLALLLSVVYSNSYVFFALVAAAFFGATVWESFRLFKNQYPAVTAAIWTLAYLFILFSQQTGGAAILFGLCVAIWLIRLAPALGVGLPPLEGGRNRLLNGLYGVAILGCFVAIAVLFAYSPLYLLSVMAIVWVADIGAYFAGKAFGKRKLAPAISPGKSWEGAIGGWIAVMVIASAAATAPQLSQTFPAVVLLNWGWAGLLLVLTSIVILSVIGDLFESQLKRRANIKDSSNLLPGHGGVLDRVDALIPTLPLAVLYQTWL